MRIFKALRSKCVGQDFQLSSNVTGTIKLEQLDMVGSLSCVRHTSLVSDLHFVNVIIR